MRLTRPLVVLSLAAALAGCSRHVTEPTPPGAAAPRMIASQPVARSAGNFYTTEIWGQFDRPLDERTVSEQSAFLKLDGQRVPCVVTYDATTQRIVLDPVPDLTLQRTYTVEFSTSIESAEGVPLAPNLYFQFSTNSLYVLTYDFPAHGDLIGPLSRLGWGGSRGPLNDVVHEVYAGADSLAVAQRLVPWIQRSAFTRLLPSVAWPNGQRIYWAITSEHTSTGERLDGPVSSFEVADAGLPVFTQVLGAKDYGSMNGTSRVTYCQRADLPAGPLYNAALHWDLFAVDALGERRIPQGARVVGATVQVTAFHTPPGVTNTNKGRFSSGPSLWLAQNDWIACSIVSPGPPYPELSGLLSQGEFVDSFVVRFSAARLAAFMEAELENDPYLHGTLLRTLENIFYESPGSSDPSWTPKLTLQYVLPGAAGPNAAAARAVRRQAHEKTAERRSVRLDPAKGRPL